MFNFPENLSLLKIPELNNDLFISLFKHCTKLKTLEIGGLPTRYNQNYSVEGIRQLCESDFVLENIRIEYCSKIGNKSIKYLTQKCGKKLKEFHIMRNNFEMTARISDEVIGFLGNCNNLERLSIVYTRKFKEGIYDYLTSQIGRVARKSLFFSNP